MPILLKNGRARSERTPEEVEDLLRKEMEHLTPAERATLEIVLKEMQQKAPQAQERRLIDVLGNAEYNTPPVDIMTFIKDPYYLGATCDGVYPKLKEDLVELFEGGYYVEAIFTGSIGWGKCVHSTTEVFDLSSGRRRTVAEAGEFCVPSMDAKGKILSKAAKAFPSGRKSCVRLILAGGQHLILSTDHKVFTSRGWVEAALIGEGDLVATPRSIPDPERFCDVSEDEVKLAAYLLSDGGCTHSITFTNETPSILDEFVGLVRTVGSIRNGLPPDARPAARQNAGKATTLNVRGVMAFVRRWGLDDHSREKRVPAEFYGLRREHLSAFLNRFWACDGSLSVRAPAKAEVTLASEGMVDDLRFMLLRLGVHARKYPKTKFYRTPSGEKRSFAAWSLTVTGASNLLHFLDVVGPVLGKEATCEALRDACSGIKSNTNTDVVPVGFDELKEIRHELGSQGSGLTARFGCPEGQLFSRARFERLCEETLYQGEHAWLAQSDLLWEHVSSVEPYGVADVYDLSVNETHSFVGNGMVLHNTFLASIGLCRILYELSCMKDPHASFGLAKDTNIALVCFSVSEALAQKVVYENIVTKIKASPYFQEHFPFEPTKKELRFPKAVWVAPRASTDTSALGLNTIAGIIDESNFLAKRKTVLGEESRAETLYNTIKRRMKSRFERQGKLPGMLFVVSSKKTNDDFTAKRINESVNDPTTFVRDYALWDVKPEDYFKTKRFWVLCGNAETASKILTDEEGEHYRDNIPEGSAVIDVPEDFRHDFEVDLEGAIRDIAGVATVAVHPFIQRREKIREAVDPSRKHPFSTLVYDMSKGGRFLWDEMVAMKTEKAPGRVEFQRLRPIISPHAARHIHIDIGLRKDALGLCMGHVAGWKDVRRRTDDGREFAERAPIYIIDLALRVVPPIGGEVLLSEVRHLVYDLTAHGYMITSVTLDQFQSADSIQTFSSRGYQSGLLSVDTTAAPYDTLKMALYEDRVRMYHYQPLIDELTFLQEDLSGNKRKIDHPSNGSKDVSDAMAAILHSLSQQKLSEPLPILKSMPYSGDAWMEEQRQAGMAGNLEAAGNSSLLPAFLLGSGTSDDWNGPWRP